MAKSSSSNGSKGGYINFFKQAAFGAVAGAVIDGFSEVSKFPLLNDAAPIGNNPSMSNAELIEYTAAGLMIIFGFLDLVAGVRFGGIGKELLPTGLGLAVGTHFYETDIANMIGARGAAPAAATPKAAAKAGGGNFSAGNYDFAGDVF
jgi:hypothetical protein